MLYSGSGYAFVCKQKRTFILQRRKTPQHSRTLLFNIEMGRGAKLRYAGVALASPELPEGGRTLFLQTPVSVSDKILFLPQSRPRFFFGEVQRGDANMLPVAVWSTCDNLVTSSCSTGAHDSGFGFQRGAVREVWGWGGMPPLAYVSR